MNCPDCELVEMRLELVENDKLHFKCKKCGKEIVKDVKELEDK